MNWSKKKKKESVAWPSMKSKHIVKFTQVNLFKFWTWNIFLFYFFLQMMKLIMWIGGCISFFSPWILITGKLSLLKYYSTAPVVQTPCGQLCWCSGVHERRRVRCSWASCEGHSYQFNWQSVALIDGRCSQGYPFHMAATCPLVFSQHSVCKHASVCCSLFSAPVKHVLNPIT